MSDLRTERHGVAWLVLCGCLALHVVDEASTGFLAVYNPNAEMIRRTTHIPIPTFTPGEFLVSLGTAIVILSLLSILVFRGTRGMVVASYVFAGVMIANGANHIAGSIYMHRFMPGVYSSPFLWAGSFLLILRARERRPRAMAALATS